ncbi:MAG: DDE-type integrase/transposase/recombinase [Candidatus Rokubacteria bacterium]|nr:DDE-type integrase/transposase/recombinase [Candidatus Rokubacteria bacterium]
MMSVRAKEEYLRAIHGRYRQAPREAKGQILDEFCANTGYHRKAALRLLNGPPPGPGRRRPRNRAATYGSAVIQAVSAIWEAAGYPWSVRLKALLPLWLPWARRRLRLSATVCQQLRRISPRQIDRRLASVKRTLKTRRYGRTKPGTLLKHHIPLKTDHWDVTVPGFTELDLVAHCGERADGEFAHSLNVADIHTTWVETRAVLGKSEIRVQEALDEIRRALPFRLRGIDSDNGSEFINDHLYRYCQAQAIQFTRGRPYKKDDNAHIEQKNWTHVRKLVGYLRYDTPAAVTALNALYRHELRLFQNLFLPSVKLVRKERVGARVRRRYDAPRTPLERVEACPDADPAAVAQWVARRDQLNPFALSQAIDRKIERLVALATTPRSRPTPPALPAAAATESRIVRRRRPPPPRHLKTPFTFANRLRRPRGRPSRVTS